jgi:hypothetical protein
VAELLAELRGEEVATMPPGHARAVLARELLTESTGFRSTPDAPNDPLVRQAVVDADTGVPGVQRTHATGRPDRVKEAAALARMAELRDEEIAVTGQRPVASRPQRRQLHRHGTTFPW